MTVFHKLFDCVCVFCMFIGSIKGLWMGWLFGYFI